MAGWKLLQEERADDTWYWPFSGSLGSLVDRPGDVIIETYPAEMYAHLDLGPVVGKGDQPVRRRCADALLAVARKLDVRLDPELKSDIIDGFSFGDDAFDAVVGLFGILNVLLGRRPEGVPDDCAVTEIEGWILGQAAPMFAKHELDGQFTST